MTIQSISGKTNTVALTSKSATQETTKNTESKTTNKPGEKVDITVVAKEITKALGSSSKATPAINEERVQAVKKALSEGTYPINAEKIAEKMIQMEREQFNDSR